MTAYEKVQQLLEDIKVPYEVVEHPPATTTEQADRYIEGKQGVRTKTLFLCNRKKTAVYLLIMDDGKRLDMKAFEQIIGVKGVKFGSEELLLSKMGLVPGTVSLFGLMNNQEKDIAIYLDREMLNEKIVTFHPNDNSKTLFITMEDMYRVIKTLGYEYTIIDLPS